MLQSCQLLIERNIEHGRAYTLEVHTRNNNNLLKASFVNKNIVKPSIVKSLIPFKTDKIFCILPLYEGKNVRLQAYQSEQIVH